MDHPIAEQSIAVTQDAPSKRLGLFGGSFNPVHNGHLAIARDVREHMQLSRILFIPTGDPPHKHNRSLAPAPIRFEMVRLAIADTPVFDVSAMELHRAGNRTPSTQFVNYENSTVDPGSYFSSLGLMRFLNSQPGGRLKNS